MINKTRVVSGFLFCAMAVSMTIFCLKICLRRRALSKYFNKKGCQHKAAGNYSSYADSRIFYISQQQHRCEKADAVSAQRKSGRRAAFMYMQNYSTFLLSGPGVVTITFSTLITRAPFAARRPFVAFSTVAFMLSAISPSAS